jgi:DNA (cytosine-5)-methyltransferase 1
VASDSNDFITTIAISAENENDYKNQFIKKVYNSGNYRKITRQEACKIQGFPDDFILPDSRSRWMKLIGNSVSVPVVEMIGEAILKTGIFLKKK